MKSPYIFISYSHKDSKTVLPIIEFMKNEGFSVWFDKGIEAGTEWPAYIESHLKQSSVFLAFLSKSAVESRNCRKEINLADKLNKEMLVVYLEKTELVEGMDLQLSSTQSLYRYNQSEESFRNSLVKAKILAPCKSAKQPPSKNDVPAPREENTPKKQNKERTKGEQKKLAALLAAANDDRAIKKLVMKGKIGAIINISAIALFIAALTSIQGIGKPICLAVAAVTWFFSLGPVGNLGWLWDSPEDWNSVVLNSAIFLSLSLILLGIPLVWIPIYDLFLTSKKIKLKLLNKIESMQKSSKKDSYQVFISYRQSIDKYIARLLYDRLEEEGYHVFDTKGLVAPPAWHAFNDQQIEVANDRESEEQIEHAIDECADFVILISKGTLEPCASPADLVRHEIEYALAKDKNVIPVFTSGSDILMNLPDDLPKTLSDLLYKNSITLSADYFDESVKVLIEKLVSKP